MSIIVPSRSKLSYLSKFRDGNTILEHPEFDQLGVDLFLFAYYTVVVSPALLSRAESIDPSAVLVYGIS